MEQFIFPDRDKTLYPIFVERYTVTMKFDSIREVVCAFWKMFDAVLLGRTLLDTCYWGLQNKNIFK